MNKICTSVKQSKKLIELGISVDTADMFYAELSIDDNIKYNLHPLESYGFKIFSDTKLKESKSLGFTPAWSLSALLELIPSNTFLYSKLVKWDESYYIEHREMLCNNPVDAAFEMVCWLKENNKI